MIKDTRCRIRVIEFSVRGLQGLARFRKAH